MQMRFPSIVVMAACSAASVMVLPVIGNADSGLLTRAVDDSEREQFVRNTVAELANRVFSSRGLDAVLELVAREDRERIGNTLDNAEHQQFITAADEVARLWREQYGHNFDASENRDAFRNLGVKFRTDEQGRERATVEFPSIAGRSRFDLRLVREGTNDWRILLPDSVTPGNFAGRMARSMTWIGQQALKDKWPDDRSKAYVHVSSQALHTLASETEPTASGRD